MMPAVRAPNQSTGVSEGADPPTRLAHNESPTKVKYVRMAHKREPMKIGTNRLLGGTAAVVLTLCACSKRDRAAADSATDTTANRVGAAVDTAAKRVSAAETPVLSGSSPPHEASSSVAVGRMPPSSDFIGANNAGEVREGQLAAKKATNPAVKKFAQQLVTEHRALALEMRSLAAKLSVTPDTADSNVHDVMDNARNRIKELTDKPAGADSNKKFIDNEIDDHKDVLDKLRTQRRARTVRSCAERSRRRPERYRSTSRRRRASRRTS